MLLSRTLWSVLAIVMCVTSQLPFTPTPTSHVTHCRYNLNPNPHSEHGVIYDLWSTPKWSWSVCEKPTRLRNEFAECLMYFEQIQGMNWSKLQWRRSILCWLHLCWVACFLYFSCYCIVKLQSHQWVQFVLICDTALTVTLTGCHCLRCIWILVTPFVIWDIDV